MESSKKTFNLFEASDREYQKCLENLGQALISFQQLESELVLAVRDLCSPDDYEAGEIIAAELSFKGLCNLASSMFRYRNPNQKKSARFDEIMAECFSIESQRNQLMHSSYGMCGCWENDPVFIRTKVTAKYKKGKRESCEAVTVEDLQIFSTRCTKARCDLGDLLSSINK